jgi:hypothetical protein
MQVRVKENNEDFGKCGCGRSPTGFCIGWHNLSESDYQEKLSDYQFKEWQRQAQETWNDSCTSDRADKI